MFLVVMFDNSLLAHFELKNRKFHTPFVHPFFDTSFLIVHPYLRVNKNILKKSGYEIMYLHPPLLDGKVGKVDVCSSNILSLDIKITLDL